MVDLNKKLAEYEEIKNAESNSKSLAVKPFGLTGNLEVLTDPEIVRTFEELANTLTDEIAVSFANDAISDRGHQAAVDIGTLAVIDDTSYHVGDRSLFDVRAARKQLASLIEQKVDPIIKPIRAGLDKLYEGRRTVLAELDKPLADAEGSVKMKMADYQAKQREAARQAEAKRLRDAAELERQARAALEVAKTSTSVGEVRAALETASQAQAQARSVRSAPPPPAPVKGAASKTVVTKKWVVKDLSALIKAVAAGTVPEMVLTVDEDVMDAYWSEDRLTMVSWPGVGVIEQTTVTGR